MSWLASMQAPPRAACHVAFVICSLVVVSSCVAVNLDASGGRRLNAQPLDVLVIVTLAQVSDGMPGLGGNVSAVALNGPWVILQA